MLILVVLLQAGKGANMGAVFGGSSQTVFGSSGAGSFLGKMTTVVATIFMLTSLFLSYTAYHRTPSLLEGAKPEVQKTVPVTPLQKQTAPPESGETGTNTQPIGPAGIPQNSSSK
jgi:preprotein translocase subunit SecG